MSMPAELKAKIAADVSRTPSPTRAQLASRTVIAVVVGLAICAALVAYRGGAHAGARTPLFLGAVALILVMFAARNLLAAVSTSLWVNPRNAQRLVVMPYVALAAIAIAYGRGPAIPHPLSDDMPCAITTLVLAGVLGVAIIIARRATEPIRPTLKAFLLGSFAAAAAAALVFLACPFEEARHFAIAHLGGALVAGGLLGAAASRIIRV
jgi:hypothetical protein